jgi:hypothetical protein
MSARKKGSATPLLAHARSVVGHLLQKPTAFAILTFDIVFRPTWTGANIIKHNNRKALLGAVTF